MTGGKPPSPKDRGALAFYLRDEADRLEHLGAPEEVVDHLRRRAHLEEGPLFWWQTSPRSLA